MQQLNYRLSIKQSATRIEFHRSAACMLLVQIASFLVVGASVRNRNKTSGFSLWVNVGAQRFWGKGPGVPARFDCFYGSRTIAQRWCTGHGAKHERHTCHQQPISNAVWCPGPRCTLPGLSSSNRLRGNCCPNSGKVPVTGYRKELLRWKRQPQRRCKIYRG